LIKESNKLGVVGIPGTFPTMYVAMALKDEIVIFDWHLEKVQNIYDFYKDAVQSGDFTPYGFGSTNLVEKISKQTGYEIGEVRAELAMIRALALDGDIDLFYWNQEHAESSIPGQIENTVDTYKKAVSNLGSTIKWGGIAILVVGGMYVFWPMIKKMRN